MRIVYTLAAVALATVAVGAAPDAHAQRRGQSASNVVVLDFNRVLAESAIGRDLQAKLQSIRNEVGPEGQALQTEQRSIEEEGGRVQQATRNMTDEQRRGNAQVQALAQRLQTFQQRRAAFEGGLQCTEALAMRDLTTQVTPTVRSIMESRGASVVLGREAVQLASPDVDITTTVIQQLDQSVRTANVSRRQVSECQSQPQQQPAGR